MTISTAYYTVGTNEPLNHARILYAPISGTITADGTNGSYAANNYTSQRWVLNPGACNWTVQTVADAQVDCVFIAAHNLANHTVTISTAATAGGAHTTRAIITPTDNTTIGIIFNDTTGFALTVREVRVSVMTAPILLLASFARV